jgi:hypothetical protein
VATQTFVLIGLAVAGGSPGLLLRGGPRAAAGRQDVVCGDWCLPKDRLIERGQPLLAV